ncbi:MAG: phosphatidate cytidylyltransferase [Bacteroidota bacterium]
MSTRFERLPTRVIVAVVAIPLIVFAIFEGGYVFFGLIGVISAIALHEFYAMVRPKGAEPLMGLGIAAGILVNAAFLYERFQIELYAFFAERGYQLKLFSQLQFLLVVLIVFVLIVLGIELFRRKGSPLLNVSTTLAGVLVISLCFGLLIGLRELYGHGFPFHKFMGGSLLAGDKELATVRAWGGWTVLSIVVAIWFCDTAAYFVGSVFGRHKLFPRVSPGKTWEGAIAGFVGAVAVMVVGRELFLPYLTLMDGIFLGVIVGVFGQMGDLVESRFKRDAGIKDSSALIPGHGGMYDRFDSLVFIAPFVYLYIDFIVLS